MSLGADTPKFRLHLNTPVISNAKTGIMQMHGKIEVFVDICTETSSSPDAPPLLGRNSHTGTPKRVMTQKQPVQPECHEFIGPAHQPRQTDVIERP
jgi:hypothetical protein